jgi:hypothetical protein
VRDLRSYPGAYQFLPQEGSIDRAIGNSNGENCGHWGGQGRRRRQAVRKASCDELLELVFDRLCALHRKVGRRRMPCNDDA